MDATYAFDRRRSTGVLETRDVGEDSVSRWLTSGLRRAWVRSKILRPSRTTRSPSFIGDSPARCDQHDIKSEFKYTAEDDGAIEEFVRKTTSLAAHPHGTCAMRSQEEGGVCWAVGIGIA